MKPELKEAVFKNSQEQEAHYIVAVRALDEGVNLPHLSAYIDLNSHVSIKQMAHRMGRVLRPSLNKLKADIFILSSYRNFEMTKELMDNITQLREIIKDSDRSTPSSPSRERLRNLAARSYNLFLRQQQFWARRDERKKNTNKEDENSLDTYFHYLSQVRRQFPPLSQSKLDALLIRFKKTGNIEVRNEIASRNLGLVTMVAQKYRWAISPTIDIMDLIQEGNRGLIKAVEKHKPELGYRFSTFAVFYIESYIKDFCFEHAHIVRITQSNEHSAVFFNLERQKDYFFSQNEKFNIDLAAKNMSTDKTTVKPETIRWMDNHLRDTISFNQPITEQRTSKGLAEEISNPERIQGFEEMYRTGIPLNEDVIGAEKILEVLIRSINNFLFQLSQKEQDIFKKRLLTHQPVPFKELGELYDLSGSRIGQIINKLVKRFKHPANWNSSELPIELWARFFGNRSSNDGKEFIHSINAYTESVYGKSFHEYFPVNRADRITIIDLDKLINSKEVLDFFVKSIRSVLLKLSPWEQDIFKKRLLTKTPPVPRNKLGDIYGLSPARIEAIEKSLIYELRHEILVSKEDSELVFQFKNYLSSLSAISLVNRVKDLFSEVVQRENLQIHWEEVDTHLLSQKTSYHTKVPLTKEFISTNLERPDIFENNIFDFLLSLSLQEQDIFKKRFLTENPISYKELSDLYRIPITQIMKTEEQLRSRFKEKVLNHDPVSKVTWSKLLNTFFYRRPVSKNNFIAFVNKQSSFRQSFLGYFDHLMNTYDRSFNKFTSSKEVHEVLNAHINDFLSNLDADKKAFFQKRFLTNPPIPFSQISQEYIEPKSNRNIETKMAYDFRELLKESFETMESSFFFLETFFRSNDPVYLKKELRRIFPTVIESDLNSYYLDAS